MNGYLDINGKPTDRIVSLQLVNISVMMDLSNVRTYELKYMNKEEIKWEIPK